MSRAALHDGPPEQSFGARHREQGADAHRAGGLAEDGDVAGVAAERGDVLLHPLERGDLVEQAEVGDAVREVEEPLGAGAPVDDDAYDAIPGEVPAVVRRRRAQLEHAALDPHHHRQTGRAGVGRPEVEVQAVLGGRGAVDAAKASATSSQSSAAPARGPPVVGGATCGGSGPIRVASRTRSTPRRAVADGAGWHRTAVRRTGPPRTRARPRRPALHHAMHRLDHCTHVGHGATGKGASVETKVPEPARETPRVRTATSARITRCAGLWVQVWFRRRVV